MVFKFAANAIRGGEHDAVRATVATKFLFSHQSRKLEFNHISNATVFRMVAERMNSLNKQMNARRRSRVHCPTYDGVV